MWFEILPSFGIIFGAMALPHAATLILHKVALGNYFKRSVLEQDDCIHYIRDSRLSGDPYKVQGLEAIPD